MPRFYQILKTLIVIMLSFSMVACGLKQFRTSKGEPCLEDGKQSNCHSEDFIQGPEGRSYLLGVVEFDDQGDLWSPRQANTLLKTIEQKVQGKPVLYVLFAHGWFHNARSSDENFKLVSQLLGYLQENENNTQLSKANLTQPRQVVGLFLGWRGNSLSVPGLKYLTFWGRKKAAEKVGANGALEVILPVEQLVKNNSDSQLIVIGHSFGAALIYSAISNIIVERQYQNQPEGFADLTLLLNPALESQRFVSARRVLREVKNNNQHSNSGEIMVLVSKSDVPVGMLFPIGRSISTVFEGHRPGQRRAGINAIGHFQPYTTHELFPVDSMLESAKVCIEQQDWKDILDQPGKLKTTSSNQCQDGELISNQFCLKPNDSYLGERLKVVSTEDSIISGHNDICNPNLIAFIYGLIKLRTNY